MQIGYWKDTLFLQVATQFEPRSGFCIVSHYRQSNTETNENKYWFLLLI